MLPTHATWILLWIPTREYERSKSGHLLKGFDEGGWCSRIRFEDGDGLGMEANKGGNTDSGHTNLEDIPIEDLVNRTIKSLGFERILVEHSEDGNFKLFQFCVLDEVYTCLFITF